MKDLDEEILLDLYDIEEVCELNGDSHHEMMKDSSGEFVRYSDVKEIFDVINKELKGESLTIAEELMMYTFKSKRYV